MRMETPTKDEHRALQAVAPAALPTGDLPGERGWTRVAQKGLLACGIVAPLVYLASDVIAGMRWEGYSFRDQTISELNAIGAPTRALTIALGLAGYTVLIAFGVGVWRSAAVRRRLRVAGGALVALGVLSLWAVPFASMHVREAEESLTDTLHLVGGAIAGPLFLVIVGFGASALGKRFRSYSIATILVMFVFVAWTGMDGRDMADNLATPWLGVKERIWVYAYQLWLVVFAIALLRQHPRPLPTARAGNVAGCRTRDALVGSAGRVEPGRMLRWQRHGSHRRVDLRPRGRLPGMGGPHRGRRRIRPRGPGHRARPA